MTSVVERITLTYSSMHTTEYKANITEKGGLEYKVGEFNHPYTVHPPHPLTAQYREEAYRWLESFSVDADLGPKIWRDFRAQETPSLMGEVYADFDLEPRTWRFLFKFCVWLFAFDSKVDETECSNNVDLSCDIILDLTLILLWNHPDDQRILNHIKDLSQSIKGDNAKGLLKRFEENLVHARNQTKSIKDIPLVPLATSFLEIWMEYSEAVPSGFNMRLAYSLCDYIVGIMWEANIRKPDVDHIEIKDYVTLRRLTGGGPPFIIFCDLFISWGHDPIAHIPQDIFFSPKMQDLVDAMSDIVCWHNDVVSFYKECVLGDNIHNLVKLLTEEKNLATYTDGGKMVYDLLSERIQEMERSYEVLRASTSPEFHPAIDLIMKACRDWVPASHAWHSRSRRFPHANTLLTN